MRPVKQSDFTEDMRILIVGGIYKKHKTGTYIAPYGTKMVTVKIDGDKARQRNILLSSFQPMKAEPRETAPETVRRI